MNNSLINNLPKHNDRSKWTSSEKAAVWELEDMYNEYEYEGREIDNEYETIAKYFTSGDFQVS